MEQILHIDALTYGAAAIGRTEEGKAVFVTGAAPGDDVMVRIEEEKPTFARGRCVEVVQAGSSRTKPFCPHAGVCGGCPWGHIAYESQLEAKRANVVDALRRIAHFDPQAAEDIVGPCRPSKRQTGYRNKIEMAAFIDKAGRFQLGFHAMGTQDTISADTCPIAAKYLQKAPKALRGAVRYLGGQDPEQLGIYRIGVRGSIRTGSCEVALWTKPSSFPRNAAKKTIETALKTTSIVRVMADPGKARAIKGTEVLSGNGFWEEDMAGFKYRVSAPSFFQVNTAQAETLIDLVVNGLEASSCNRIADLYCGVGTFTLPLADVCDDVVAVESAASSVRDLRRNVEDNQIWVDCLGGDSTRELKDMGHVDALVVDPPRSGLGKDTPEAIAQAQPSRIAYVSCDPATWARDITRLEEVGLRLKSAVPVDLFPQTYHCEVVSIFERVRP